MIRGIRFLLCFTGLMIPQVVLAQTGGNLQPLDAVFQVNEPQDRAAQRLSLVCVSQSRGVRLACDPHWQIRYSPQELIVRISHTPVIELRLEQSDHRFPAGALFGRAELRDLKRYNGWFDMKQFHDCGRQLTQVKGYLNATPRARAFDYYLLDRKHIYAIQFTSEQAIAFDEYQPIFEEIIDSVEFVTENKDTVNFRTPNMRQCQTITRE